MPATMKVQGVPTGTVRANNTAVTTALKSVICTLGSLPRQARHTASKTSAAIVAINMFRSMPMPKNQQDETMPGHKQIRTVVIRLLTDLELVCLGEDIVEGFKLVLLRARFLLLWLFSKRLRSFVF